MRQIGEWIVIAIILGILAGMVYHISRKRKLKASEQDSDDATNESEGTSNMLLIIFVVSLAIFLILWLVSAITGFKILCY